MVNAKVLVCQSDEDYGECRFRESNGMKGTIDDERLFPPIITPLCTMIVFRARAGGSGGLVEWLACTGEVQGGETTRMPILRR